MHGSGIVSQWNSRIRDCKQCLIVFGVTHQHIEEVVINLGVILHVGHIAVSLGDTEKRFGTLLK